MKKRLIICSTLFSTIILTSLVTSCTKPFVPEPNYIPISNKVVEEVYNQTINDFEEYFLKYYGNSQKPVFDYYLLQSYLENMNGAQQQLIDKFSDIFDTNKVKILKEIKYRNDDIKLSILQKEEPIGCFTIENEICNPFNTFQMNDEIKQIATINLGTFDIKMSSNENYGWYHTQTLIIPIQNYWTNKKDYSTLWLNHNAIISNHTIVEPQTEKQNYFATNYSIWHSKISNLESVLSFIWTVEDMFGKFLWDMKDAKSTSFVYTYLADQFKSVIPIVGANDRYNAINFYKERPWANLFYCEIFNESAPINEKHYCGQLELLKLKFESIDNDPNYIGQSIEIKIQVNINPEYKLILKDPSESYFTMYFGEFEISQNGLYIWSFK